MQPLITFAILPQDACLEQALSKKKDPPSPPSEWYAYIGKKKWDSLTPEEQKAHVIKMHKARWGKKKKKKPRPRSEGA